MTEKFLITSTEYGKVRGVNLKSVLDTSYNRFLGIPYAKPPINDLRFTVSSDFTLSCSFY